MAEHNCSLLQAESIVTAKHFEQLDTATKLIRTAFEKNNGHLTINDKVVA